MAFSPLNRVFQEPDPQRARHLVLGQVIRLELQVNPAVVGVGVGPPAVGDGVGVGVGPPGVVVGVGVLPLVGVGTGVGVAQFLVP